MPSYFGTLLCLGTAARLARPMVQFTVFFPVVPSDHMPFSRVKVAVWVPALVWGVTDTEEFSWSKLSHSGVCGAPV